MRKLSVLLLALGLSLVLSCASRDGKQNNQGVYTECYRILLSESTQTVEGRARRVPKTKHGIWVIETVDGVARIKAGDKYVDASIRLDCSVLDF